MAGHVFWPEGPWRDREHVELETLNYVDWFSNERRHESIDDNRHAHFVSEEADDGLVDVHALLLDRAGQTELGTDDLLSLR
jgi:hypothetical protein